MALWDATVRACEPFAAEFRLQRPDGSEAWVLGQVRPERDVQGLVVGFLATATEITEQKRTESDCRQSEKLLQEATNEGNHAILNAIVEHANDAIFIKDLEGRFIFANQAAATFLDRTHTELIGRSDVEVLGPDVAEQVREGERRVAETRQPQTSEREYVLSNGARRTFGVVKSPYISPNGKVLGTIAIARDVTERRQVELALRRSNALLRAQREAAIDGVLAIDEHRALVGYNRRWVEIWGIPQALLDTQDGGLLRAHVLSQIKDAAQFEERTDYLLAHPYESSRDEFELKDGRVLDCFSASVLSPEGEYFGRIWYLRDITERKRLERALVDQNEKLKQLDRLKNNFVNMISHDLRTPLTSILGYAEFLEDESAGPLSGKQREFVTQIERSAARLDHMVQDLLEIARLDAGAFELKCQGVDFGRLAEEVVASLLPQFEARRLRLEAQVPAQPLMAWLDRDLIERVLLNLLSNAIKFTPSGGTIRISASVVDGAVRCEVADTGIGIADNDLPKLFRRFSQLDTKLKRAGTGLGLSIVKTVVEAHGGAVGVESVPGEGSTFWFTLPRGETEATPGLPSGAQA